MTSVGYPLGGPTYTYSFDSMSRPAGLTDKNSNTIVSGLSFGPANEVLSMNYNGTGEIRTYNNMLQVTGVVGNGIGMTYVYPGPGANNGKACLAIDYAAGEQVAYSYDSLNRLSTANAYTNGGASGCTPSGSQTWGQSYTYDVYGNLTDKNVTAGSAPSLHVIADAATNRVSGFGYDANGNATAKSDGTMDTAPRIA